MVVLVLEMSVYRQTISNILNFVKQEIYATPVVIELSAWKESLKQIDRLKLMELILHA